MKIFVEWPSRTINGRAMAVIMHVEASDTIDDVKAEIQKIGGFPPAQQRLFFAGNELKDGRYSVSSYNIRNESALEVIWVALATAGLSALADPAGPPGASPKAMPRAAGPSACACSPLRASSAEMQVPALLKVRKEKKDKEEKKDKKRKKKNKRKQKKEKKDKKDKKDKQGDWWNSSSSSTSSSIEMLDD